MLSDVIGAPKSDPVAPPSADYSKANSVETLPPNSVETLPPHGKKKENAVIRSSELGESIGSGTGRVVGGVVGWGVKGIAAGLRRPCAQVVGAAKTANAKITGR